ncbi:MAG: hypothetical protein ACOX1S_12660 [Anaerostipes sp.]|jgi:hypothetical protein
MNHKAIEKINSIGRAGSIVALIVKIIIVIAFIACLVGTVAVTVLPDDFFSMKIAGKTNLELNLSSVGVSEKELSESFHLEDEDIQKQITSAGVSVNFDKAKVEGSKIIMSGSSDVMNVSMKSVRYAMICILVLLAMTFAMMMFIGFLTKAFARCASPFDEEVIRRMKHFSFFLVAWAVVSAITSNIINNVVTTGRVILRFNVNISYVFIVLVILALVYIFQYGAELQKETDELI